MREPRVAYRLLVEVVRPLILNWMEVHILRRGFADEHGFIDIVFERIKRNDSKKSIREKAVANNLD